ncbi:MAG: pyroglutamyl-peptidase I [Bacteroidales bacterium]|nr:pyroglutamyl-peptidase I [Bacteroidales bacterium]
MAEKILITGFTPFGSEKENPSQMVVEAFDDTFCGVEVVKAILPVSFAKAGKMIVDLIEDVRPDVVICLGQAGGRNEPSIERIAVNLNDSNKADNDGDIPEERVIVSGGASAYFSSLPIKDIVKNIKASGLPATVSNTAGLFVCNHVFYLALHYVSVRGLATKVGFIHLPYLPQQVIDKKGKPYMSLCDMLTVLKVAIGTTINKFYKY